MLTDTLMQPDAATRRLNAAAPAMLAMLKALAGRAGHSGRLVGWDSDTLDAMRALIRRAEKGSDHVE